MPIDRDGLTRVLEAFEQGEWDEIHLVTAGIELHLRASQGAEGYAQTSHVSGSPRPVSTGPGASSQVAGPVSDSPDVDLLGPLDEIVAPSPGIFWRSPSPGAPPFADVGAPVEADAVLCIVEVMKLMNPISAPRPGVVVDVLVGNGEQVERGQALFRIRPDEA